MSTFDVREAKSLESLGCLKLTSTTKMMLVNNYRTLDAIIKEGREIAYLYEINDKAKYDATKWRKELVKVLREEGFIRPAEELRGIFNVNVLYRDIEKSKRDKWYPVPLFKTRVLDLSNEEYEKLVGLPDHNLIREITKSLKTQLSERDFSIICSLYGVIPPYEVVPVAKIATKMKMAPDNIRHCADRALRKIAHAGMLPPILEAPSKISLTASSLIKKLNKLKEEENEVLAELDALSKTPYKLPPDTEGHDPSSKIEKLGISPRMVNTLKRNGIRTIQDVLSYPESNWAMMKNFGKKSVAELKQIMHESGYPDFMQK